MEGLGATWALCLLVGGWPMSAIFRDTGEHPPYFRPHAHASEAAARRQFQANPFKLPQTRVGGQLR